MLSADSTLGMNAVTATSIFSLHPELLRKRQCQLRNIAPTGDMPQIWNNAPGALEMGCEVVLDNSHLTAACTFCPRWRIRMSGGRGFGMLVWNLDMFAKHPHEEYAVWARSRFMSSPLRYNMQWSSCCYNPFCPYVNRTPKFLGVNGDAETGMDYFVSSSVSEEHAMYMRADEEPYRKDPVTWDGSRSLEFFWRTPSLTTSRSGQLITDDEVLARENYVGRNVSETRWRPHVHFVLTRYTAGLRHCRCYLRTQSHARSYGACAIRPRDRRLSYSG